MKRSMDVSVGGGGGWCANSVYASCSEFVEVY